ncbi:MAG: cobalamin-dependent protein [Deltaproteobacteria bacterium]|nr:cobalamin-dependent protein [Deltaproteobacteria bacterium]
MLYIMSSTSDRHEKVLIDLCFEEDPRTALRGELEAVQPDLVAISMRNIQNNDYSGISDNLAYYAELIDIARDASAAPVALGESGFSVMPRELMGRLKPDFGIFGEGEKAFPQLVSALENDGEGLNSIGALLHWKDGSCVVNPRPPEFLNLTELPFPERALVDRYYDEEFAQLAYEAGCTGMEVRSDPGCDHVLERLRKGFTTEHIRRMNKICTAAKIPDCHTFILGTEGETMDDVRQTIDFLVDLDPYSAIIMVWVDDYETLDPELRKQRMKLRAEIEKLLIEHQYDFPHWSIPALGINFDDELFRKLRSTGRTWASLAASATPFKAGSPDPVRQAMTLTFA